MTSGVMAGVMAGVLAGVLGVTWVDVAGRVDVVE
jgi:hypothetical protein